MKYLLEIVSASCESIKVKPYQFGYDFEFPAMELAQVIKNNTGNISIKLLNGGKNQNLPEPYFIKGELKGKYVEVDGEFDNYEIKIATFTAMRKTKHGYVSGNTPIDLYKKFEFRLH